MREVKLHVETLDHFIGKTMAMAEGLDRGERERQAAHIAFESMENFLKVLTPNRWALLRALRGRGPSSIRALAQTLGRDYRGVHADVTALVDAGLIERDNSGAVSVPWSRVTAEMALDVAASA
ncbi:MAG: MarR family transcriptional regulator [Halioglobus sp.]|nr:MarR family transcriptional regulator [Halioglobus sp.]